MVSTVDGIGEVRCYLYVDGFGPLGEFTERGEFGQHLLIADPMVHQVVHELQLREWRFVQRHR